MDFENIVQQTIAYGQRNTTVVLVAAAVLVLLTIFKPKVMMKLCGICVFALIVLYLIMLFNGALSSGIKQKDEMINKTPQAIGE